MTVLDNRVISDKLYAGHVYDQNRILMVKTFTRYKLCTIIHVLLYRIGSNLETYPFTFSLHYIILHLGYLITRDSELLIKLLFIC